LPLQEAYPGLAGKIETALDAGFGEEEIEAKILERMEFARDSGYLQAEIEEYIGITPMDVTRAPAMETPAIGTDIAQTPSGAPIAPQITPVPSDFEAVAAGSPMGATLEAVPDIGSMDQSELVKQFGRETFGLGEAALEQAGALASFFPESAIAGFPGVYKLLTTGDLNEATKAIEETREAIHPFLVRIPKSKEGKVASERVGKFLDWMIAKPAAAMGEMFQEHALDKGMFLSTLPIPQKAKEHLRDAGAAFFNIVAEFAGYAALLGGPKKLKGKAPAKPKMTEEGIIELNKHIPESFDAIKEAEHLIREGKPLPAEMIAEHPGLENLVKQYETFKTDKTTGKEPALPKREATPEEIAKAKAPAVKGTEAERMADMKAKAKAFKAEKKAKPTTLEPTKEMQVSGGESLKARGAKEIKEIEEGKTFDFMNPLKSEKGIVDISGIKEATKSMRKRFGLSDPTSKLGKGGVAAVERWRIHKNTGKLKAQRVHKAITDIIPDSKQRAEITHALDSPEKVKALTPEQKKMHNEIQQMYSNYAKTLKEEGILDAQREAYVNHIILSKPTAGKAAKPGLGALSSRPGFTRQRKQTPDGKDFTLQEWKDLGYEVVEDIADLVAIYQNTAEQAIANKRLVDYLKTAKTENGQPALQVFSKIPFEEKGDYLYVDEMQLQKHAGRAIETKKGKKATVLFTEPTGLHKDLWPTIDNILHDRRPPGPLYKGFAKTRGGVKRVIMFNPLIHGFNTESNVMMALGTQYPIKRLQKMTPEKIARLEMEMVESGVELIGLFDVSKRLELDAYELKIPSTKSLKEHVTNPLKAIKETGDRILWDKFVKSGQMLVFETLRERFERGSIVLSFRRGPDGVFKIIPTIGRKKTMTKAEAGRAAAMMTNDLLGTLPQTWFTKNQRRVLFALMFARNWTVSNLRTLTGATGGFARSQVLPKFLRFEDVTDAQLKAMSSQYRRVIIKGVIGAVVSAEAVQMMLQKINSPDDVHHIWENEEGHKLDIDTGIIDAKGRKVYIKNWLFRQITDYAALMEGHVIEFSKAKAEPIMRSIAEVVINADYRGEKIRKKGATRLESAKAVAMHMFTGMTPVDTFTGREGEVRSLVEKLLPFTGTWVRRGMPTGSKDPVMGDMLKDYYTYRDKKKLLSVDVKNQAAELAQKGEFKELGKLIDKETFTQKQAVNVIKRIKDPFAYRVGFKIDKNGIPKFSSDFIEFLMSLEGKEKEKYIDAIKRFNRQRFKPKEE